MTMPIDLKLVELLCSRLCHDLIGPIGAINNGLELLEDYDPSMADDVLPLLNSSAKQAWGRLAFFRAALGVGGGRAAWSAADLRRIADGMFSSDKVSVEWLIDDGQDIGRHQARLLLNLSLVAAETLTRGGAIRVSITPVGAGSRISVEAVGPDVALAPRHRQGLTAAIPVAELEERGIHAFMTGLMVAEAGATIHFAEAPGKVAFEATL